MWAFECLIGHTRMLYGDAKKSVDAIERVLEDIARPAPEIHAPV